MRGLNNNAISIGDGSIDASSRNIFKGLVDDMVLCLKSTLEIS